MLADCDFDQFLVLFKAPRFVDVGIALDELVPAQQVIIHPLSGLLVHGIEPQQLQVGNFEAEHVLLKLHIFESPVPELLAHGFDVSIILFIYRKY